MPTSANTPDQRSDGYARYIQVGTTPATHLSRWVHPNGTTKSHPPPSIVKALTPPRAVVRPPSVERIEVQQWSTEEASRFLAATVDHRLHALFAVGVAIGLRKGELLALRWDDVDLDDGVLHVRQTYNDYQRWASYSVLQSRTSRAAEFRFPLPRRGCSEPTARIRLPKPLRSDRPGSTPALSSPQRSAR